MHGDKFIILSILKNFLGEPRTSYGAETRNQWEFNCPSMGCRHDHDKFNLAFNSEHNIFKCWKCGERGVVHKLVKKYGSSADYKKLELVLPYYDSNYVNVFRKSRINHDLITCKWPSGYLPLNKQQSSAKYKLAREYMIEERKVSQEIIDKYKIGYTEYGERRDRIIIPSFNTSGKLNYFEARTFIKNKKPTYLKPDEPDKFDIIFNESNINWDLPIYLVEGPFDMLRLLNCIPMLGKIPSDLLIAALVGHKTPVVVCVDEDALLKGLSIYEQLTSLGLRVEFIDLTGLGDVSKVYEDYGQKGISELLQTKKKIDFVYFIEKILQKEKEKRYENRSSFRHSH